MVLSHGFWQRHFGGDPLVVGRTLSLNGKPVTVIGVAPAEFSGLTMDEPRSVAADRARTRTSSTAAGC